jgi:hypothetical protein
MQFVYPGPRSDFVESAWGGLGQFWLHKRTRRSNKITLLPEVGRYERSLSHSYAAGQQRAKQEIQFLAG